MISPGKIHLALQECNRQLPECDSSVSLMQIAEKLQVSYDDLLVHIVTLHDLYYIRFTDHANNKVRLTYTGKNTIVPE